MRKNSVIEGGKHDEDDEQKAAKSRVVVQEPVAEAKPHHGKCKECGRDIANS